MGWKDAPVVEDQTKPKTGWQAAPEVRDQSWSGTILPFSKDAQGNVHFDANAGLIGVAKRAFMTPGDVYTGKIPSVDPETGHVSGQLVDRANEMGAMFSPVSPAARVSGRALPSAQPKMKPVQPPTAEALKSASKAGYEAARNMGVDYEPGAVRDMLTGAGKALDDDGLIKEIAPKTHAVLAKALKSLKPPKNAEPGDRVVAPLTGLDSVRKSLRKAAGDFGNPSEQAAARRVIDQLDQFMERPAGSVVVSGPAAEAGKALVEARGNYGAYKRSQQLTGISTKAERRAKAANSGWNIDNTIRQRVASLLDNPKQIAGFSDEEIAALDLLATGTRGRNAARAVGNLLGGGGGLGGYVTGAGGAAAGAMAGLGPLGTGAAALAGPAIGMTGKATGNYLTRRAMQQADKMIRMRSPLFERMAAEGTGVPAGTATESAAMRVIIETLLANQRQPDRSTDPIIRTLAGY